MINILAIGAHPDDIELGCSATLMRYKKAGAKIHLLILTKGEASGDPELREKECRKSAEIIGADNIFFGGLEDTKINDGVKTIMIIERILEQVKPDIIYSHDYKDTHQDHRNTSYATLSAGRRSKKIFMRLFSSQSSKEWWAIGDTAAMAIEGLAAYRGFQAGLKVAEAFEVGKLVISKDEVICHNKKKSTI